MVLTSPMRSMRPFLVAVSTAHLLSGSCLSSSSSTASDMLSQILSGCPSVTLSLVIIIISPMLFVLCKNSIFFLSPRDNFIPIGIFLYLF